ncbi:MAG: hypothetical protein ACJ8AK_03135 [Gemmatimonadaceae bacterium]
MLSAIEARAVSVGWWGQFTTLVAIVFLVLFIFRGTVDFRAAAPSQSDY